MANINNRVKLWRGTRANYNALGTWDYWTEYNVKEPNGTWTKYYGTKEVVGDSGELAPVKGILSPAEFGSLDASGKTQGSRWLVGSGDSYYVVEFGPNASVEAAKIQPLGSYSVRVEDRGLRAYELVDGELYTYDVLFSSGNTPTSAQTLDEINFEEENGVISGYVLLDGELDPNSPHAVSNSAITNVILENEEVVSAALNDLNDRIDEIADVNISGSGVISTSGDISTGIIISHDEANVNETSSASTLTNGGTFLAVTNVSEDAYGHVSGITATTYTLPASVTTVTATGDTYVSANVSNGSAITINTDAVTALTDSEVSGTVADSKAIVDYVKSKIGAIKNVTSIGGVAVPSSATTFNLVSGNTLITVTTAANGNDGITTTITPVTATTTSSTVGLVTNEEVKRYVEDLLTSVMHFRGATGSLPATAETGDVYIVATSFTVGNETAEVGDYIVYYQAEGAQQGQWTIIEKNDTGVVTSTGLTTNAVVVADASNSVVSAGSVGSATRPIYLNNGVPTPITEAVSGTSELVFGSAVTLATIEGIEIKAELPEFEIDDELDSASTNPVENRVLYEIITQDEETVSAALNDLNDRKADISYVDEVVSSITIDVDSQLDSASTNPVENRAIYEYITEIEEVASAALNDLNDRKADKSYVDELVSSITIDVDTELDSASTNPVENRVLYQIIVDDEETVASALNDLEDRKADISYVDEVVSSITIDVDTELDTGSTNPVMNSAVTNVILEIEQVVSASLNDLNNRKVNITDLEEGYYTKDEVDDLLSSGVTIQSLTINGANGTNGIVFDGSTPIEITLLDCGEY